MHWEEVPMPNDEYHDRGEQLAQQTHSIRSKTDELHGRVLSVARTIMETEEAAARTLDHVANDHPDRAARLRLLSEAARANAAYERQWIADHSPDG